MLVAPVIVIVPNPVIVPIGYTDTSPKRYVAKRFVIPAPATAA